MSSEAGGRDLLRHSSLDEVWMLGVLGRRRLVVIGGCCSGDRCVGLGLERRYAAGDRKACRAASGRKPLQAGGDGGASPVSDGPGWSREMSGTFPNQ